AGIPRDLETIGLRCLEKDLRRRYASARELAEELTRFLEHRPILTRPISPLERAAKWTRRQPKLALSIAVIVVLALAVAVVSAVMAWRLARAGETAERENYFSTIGVAQKFSDEGQTERALDLLLRCPERYRHWEWGRLLLLCHPEVRTLETGQGNM